MGVKMSGFDEFNKKLKEMEQKAKELERGVSVGFGDLFNDGFMAKYTEFDNIDEFFDKSPFDVQTDVDFDNIDIQKFDEYVRIHTEFSGWEDMKSAAGTEWAAKQIGF